MHATAFLGDAGKLDIPPVVVLHGPERYLLRAALEKIVERVLGQGEGDDELGLARFEGSNVDLKTIVDELSTISMWGDRRVIAVDEADPFVSENRSALERYIDKPAKKSVFVLMVKSWPKTTRLAKRVAQVGLDIECSPLKGAALIRWLTDLARSEHGKQLERDAAALMVELAGPELGLLAQELEKLAAFVGERASIGVDDVRTLVGGWRAETTWVMIDALRTGNLPLALVSLDKLLSAGEAPQKILGGVNFVFRKLAVATELARQGAALNTALAQASCFPSEIQSSAAYLRRVGRQTAERIYALLLEADGDMKGGSRLSEQLQLERLLVRLSGRVPGV
ncbi:MAG: DNA polymerase III subunit delta, partial [Planctomycetaceae bacterium]